MEPRERTPGQVDLLGVQVKYTSKKHEGVSLVHLNVSRSQSSYGKKLTRSRDQRHPTGAPGCLGKMLTACLWTCWDTRNIWSFKNLQHTLPLKGSSKIVAIIRLDYLCIKQASHFSRGKKNSDNDWLNFSVCNSRLFNATSGYSSIKNGLIPHHALENTASVSYNIIHIVEFLILVLQNL